MTDCKVKSINQKICVTGATGFVGRHLLKFLVESKRGNVVALTRTEKGRIEKIGGVQYFQGDLLNPKSLGRFVENGRIVINLAYLKNAGESENIKAAKNLADVCRNSSVDRVVHTSTAVVVGRTSEQFITESTPCSPRTEYERTKLAVEDLLCNEGGSYFDVVVARPTAVFGVGGRNIEKLAMSLLQMPRVYNLATAMVQGRRRMNLVPVEAVVSALWHIASQDEFVHFERFLVSSDEDGGNNYLDVANILAKEFGKRALPDASCAIQRAVLSSILRLRGRSQFNSEQVYSSKKLTGIGWRQPITIRDAVAAYAKNLSTRKCIGK